tara:strand:- start:145 stop:879 length:735 start_codon:yes stop_codon:yes gene_type:complete
MKKITIVTPVFNGEKYIEATIKSVINQSYNNLEYIVVDGGSKDNTINIIEKYRDKIDKIIYQNDNSMYEALETGFSKSTGNYLHWLNSDDYLLDNNSVERLMLKLNKYEYEWVICNISMAKLEASPKIYFPLVYPRSIIKSGLANNCFWGFIQQENTIFTKKIYEKAGGIDPKFKMAGDYDLWKRLAKFNKLKTIKVKYACHRKSENQLTDLDKYYSEIKKRRCKFNILYPIRFIYSLLLYPFI